MANKKKQKQIDKEPHHQDDMQASNSNETDDQLGYGFSTDDEPNPAGSADDSVAVGENSAYGFFDESDNAAEMQSTENSSAGQVVHLGSELTIQNVAACKQLIDDEIATGLDVTIAAGDIQKIDSAGLQLLYSLKQSLEKSAQGIHWQGTSAIINQSARQLGMPDLIQEGNDEAYGFFDDQMPAEPTDSQQQDAGYGFF